MSILHNVILGIAVISFVTFVALFGQLPALRKTPIGWLQRALCIHVPRGLHAIDRHLTNGQVTRRSKALGNYLFYEKNPVVLVLFLVLLTGCAVLFLANTLHLLPVPLLLPIPILLPMPYVFTYLCAAHTAHYITPSNHEIRLHDYPYDHILFRPHNDCTTCTFEKPARSKHCSLCRACVAKSDHHCPWVNACLGRGNYRWFLALLLSLGVLEYYAAFLSWWLLRQYLTFPSSAPMFSLEYASNAIDVLAYAVMKGGLSIAGVGMLAIATAALPLGLLAYHLYLIWAGMTTNESQKWSDLQEDMADGEAFEASRTELQKHLDTSKKSGGDRFLGLLAGVQDEPYARWPKKTDCVVVCTSDGEPPYRQEHLWRRIWHLDHIDNIYDLGGWKNFLEVLHGR